VEEESHAMRFPNGRRLALLTALLLLTPFARMSAQEQPATQLKPANPALAPNYEQSEWFPNIFSPYTARLVPQPTMTNSKLLHSLLQNGKLELSLQDAITLALENNLDIDVARYSLAYAQTDILRTKSGGSTRGINPALFGGVTAFGGGVSGGGGGGTGGAGGFSGSGGAVQTGQVSCCDPFAGVTFGLNQATTPLNTIQLTGVPTVSTHTTSVSTFFGQGFLTGSSYVVAVSGSRQSTSSGFQLFDPYVPTGLEVGFNQKLLNGFGYRANARFIRIAKNDVGLADSTFRQQVITTISNVLNLYYGLVYDKQNVQVAQQALAYDQQLLSDDKKQVQIGTLAPLEVVRAESQVAADEQALVVAQTTYLQQQETLKTAISKHVDPDFAQSTIEATNSLPQPVPGDVPPLAEAIKQAEASRPEIRQDQINIRNQDITIQQARNALLPTLDFFATYLPTGLSGNRLLTDSAGNIIGTAPGGISQSLSQALHNNYPNYSAGLTLTIPIRNRSAQADMATALLQSRMLDEQLQAEKNTVDQDVRNAEIAVAQAKAQINAAQKAAVLAKETLADERKKLELGESTTLNVILTEEQYITALGNQTLAHNNYAKALVQFYQATGMTLDRYNIQLAEAKTGQVTHMPNIPGTPTQQLQQHP
jgi:outer membrane protein